jgi:large subunit ribosomal protein L15
MQQHEITPAEGSHHSAKRVGRGNASGHGTYSGRGCKGNKARAGWGVRPGFEGGQLPIIKRLPEKRGFTNLFKTRFNLVNLKSLCVFEAGSVVDTDAMIAARLIKNDKLPVKILGVGEVDRPLTVKAHKFSGAAKSAIEAAGGKAEEVAHGAESS